MAPLAGRAPTEQRRQMEDTRATHNGNHSFYRLCTRTDTGEKRTSAPASWRSNQQQHLGGRKNRHRLQEGVAPRGVTDVDKTSAMPAIGFPWRFPASTVTIRPAGRGALQQSLQRGMRHYKCRYCRMARSQVGISPGAPTTTGLVGELNTVSTEGAEARGDLVAGDSPSQLH